MESFYATGCIRRVGCGSFWGMRKDVGPCAQGVQGGWRMFEGGARLFLACGMGIFGLRAR